MYLILESLLIFCCIFMRYYMLKNDNVTNFFVYLNSFNIIISYIAGILFFNEDVKINGILGIIIISFGLYKYIQEDNTKKS
jgi:uncharacterized membrane protein